MAHHHFYYDSARPSSQYNNSPSFLHSHQYQQQHHHQHQHQHQHQQQQYQQQQEQQQRYHQQSLAHQSNIYPSYAQHQQSDTCPSSPVPTDHSTTDRVPSSPPYLFECPNVACPRAYKMVSELNAHLAQTKCRSALTNTSGPPPAPQLLDTHPGPSLSLSASLSSIPSSSSTPSFHSFPPNTSSAPAPTPYRQLSGIEAIIHASLRADAEAEAKVNVGTSSAYSHVQIDRASSDRMTTKKEVKHEDHDINVDEGEDEIEEDQDEDDIDDEDDVDEDDKDEDEDDDLAAGNQLERTFKCPNFGCSKAYKQSNGLKYHFKKGQCDFGVRDIIAKGASEEQAEKQVRPFVCLVDGCERKYRQQNGLMYHYMNSGEHGHKGIALIEAGVHPHPKGGMIPRYRSIYLHAHKAHYPDPTVTVHVPALTPSSSDSTALSSCSSSVVTESSPSIPPSRLVRQTSSIPAQLSTKQHSGRIDDDEGTEDALMALVALAGGFANSHAGPTGPEYAPTPTIKEGLMLDNMSGPDTLLPIDGSSHRSSSGVPRGRGRGRGRGTGTRGRGTGSGTGRGRGRPRTTGFTQSTLKKTVSPSMDFSPLDELIEKPKPRDGILFDCPNTRCVRTYGTKHELTYHITLGRCKYKILDGRSRGGTGKNQDKDSDEPDEIMEKTSFGCPNPGCGKTYKFKKGLINHLEPGVCPFGIIEKDHTPSLPRSHTHVLPQNSNGSANMTANTTTNNESATKNLMLKVAKPYACQAGGGCLKRYALMHGLRYHYSKSGEHGKIGLELLRQGKHQSANGGVFPPTTY